MTIDLTFLKKFTKDDPTKMKRYIGLYLDVAPKTFDEMKRNVANDDWEQLRINAHSLKPQADFMGINNLKEELVKIEEAVRPIILKCLKICWIHRLKLLRIARLYLKRCCSNYKNALQ